MLRGIVSGQYKIKVYLQNCKSTKHAELPALT